MLPPPDTLPAPAPAPGRRASDRRQRVASVLASVLVEEGVEVVFGIPGGPIAPLNDAFLDRPELRVVTSRHENGAMFSACGYARTTGRLGVVLVTSGPGILNGLTGLASAFCDGLPLLVLVGEVPKRLQGRNALQDGSAHNLGVLGMVRSISKLAIEVPEANAAAAVLRRAMGTALSGRQGPVVVTLPMDILSAQMAVPEVSVHVETSFSVAESVVTRVAETIAHTRRGVIFAGSGMRGGAGPVELLRFAEHLGWPVMTTPKGKGVFPESHPLSLGVFGMGGHPSTQAYLQGGVETVLAIGTSLGDLATNGFSDLLRPTRSFIHVDVDSSQVGRNYAAHLTVVAPGASFLAALRPRIASGPASGSSVGGRQTFLDPGAQTVGSQGLISPVRAVWEAQAAMPPDTIWCVDSGEHYFYATHYLSIDRPEAYVVQTGLGSMGSGIGASVGASLAHRGRPVAVICGDAGFAMMPGEVATAAAHGLPVTFFVLNDRRLGMVELGHTALYGRTPDFGTGPIDIAGLGRSLGAEAFRVDAPGQIAALPPHRADGPRVVEVRIDPSVTMPKNKRFEVLKDDA